MGTGYGNKYKTLIRWENGEVVEMTKNEVLVAF